MATPHVTGLIAYTLGQKPELATDPAGMKKYILSEAISGEVSGTAGSGDKKLLLNNGITGAAKLLRRSIDDKFVVRRSSSGLVGLAARAASWLDKRQTLWLTERSGGLYY
jgi:subtilisin family serine protease